MTHAESQDLLLDLAYGELDAARAAEVEGHLSSCAECRAQKAALDETRRMAAPLRELEEPSPAFDHRILQAARAQAQLEHEGNVGQVIEVTGSVRPLGMEAARIDAHGPVKARPVQRRRPAWMKRAALGGSVAAAAALALVIGNTLETRQNRERVAAARKDDYQIRVEPAGPRPVEIALREAEAKKQAGQASPPSSPAIDVSSDGPAVAAPPPPVQRPVPMAGGAQRLKGSGGDAASSLGKSSSALKAAPAPAAKERARDKKSEAREQDQQIAMDHAGATPGAPVAAGQPAPAAPSPMSDSAQASSGVIGAEPRLARTPAVADALKETAPPGAAGAGSANAAAVGSAASAGTLEGKAQQARHAANYLVAASLYRDAATLRRRENDPGAAAWNLAHAVECLAAVGRFDEARQVRDELTRLFPTEAAPLSAARRALREVDPPVPAVVPSPR